MSVRHALLALLSAGPKYGLQLRDEFEANTGEVWPLNVGQVYTTLQRLERDGMVDAEGTEVDGPHKSYRITDDGRAELTTWLRTPTEAGTPPRDELLIKVMIAGQVPGVDVHAVIQEHRRRMVETMQQWTRLKEDAGPDDLALVLALDFELFRIDAVVRWLDTADARIRRAGPAPKVSPLTQTGAGLGAEVAR
ncbi:MAG TPA: PadR family transcriptional regulator [Acidimicrobiales bacterium]|jgi:DNA-binding PadR family transcriptional regulator|nr:PadR family transcriptional regulator [Acidimicrobiales bacterium]